MPDQSLEVSQKAGPEEESEVSGEVAEKESKDEQQESPAIDLDKMSKDELAGKVRELLGLSEKNHDLYLRSQAEMENMRKRAKKEKEDWLKYSNETLIKQILPVMDNLHKAISHSNNEKAFHALREGVELTLTELRSALSKAGLEEIKAEGEPFDPKFHEAVSQVEDKDVEAGRVVKEIQKGYLLNKRLIRPSMVVVNKG